MKTFLITTISLFIFSFSLIAQEPVTQIEGFLEVHPSDDTTSVYIGKSAGQKSIVNLNFPGRNTFFGSQAGPKNTTGQFNSFFGYSAGFLNTIGNRNSFFGNGAGSNNSTGERNTFIGSFSGNAVNTQSRIIAIGVGAGPSFGQGIDDRLYIDVEQSNTPLIYGEFDNGLVTIHQGADESLSSYKQGLRIT